MNKWKEIFESSKNSKVWRWCIVISILAIILMAYIDNYDPESDIVPILEKALPQIFSSIATGVLGAAFLNIVYHESENRKLNSMKSLKYDDMLAYFFEALHKLDGKVRRDENISVKFLEFKNKEGVVEDSLYKIRIEYSYKTSLKNDCIKMKFERINGEQKKVSEDAKNIQSMQRYTVGLNEELMGYEFYWGNDETGFKNGLVCDDDYRVYDVGIESYRSDLKSEKPSQDSSVLEYTYKLPPGKKLEDATNVSIRFTVEFPMERESIMFLTHELPTENTEVKIDYSAVKDKTNFYTMSVTGTIPVQKSVSQGEDGIELYNYSGWIIPKAGYIIAWWDEDEKFSGKI